ncbi:hypothetical protein ACFV0T_30870 [Streptomyces sp. NPDC059582]|uniref:hypothetical protein n=1 Tax=Streptomyces sp. NPDC059582 TaxID=3346875 RepID=UPI0036AC77F0
MTVHPTEPRVRAHPSWRERGESPREGERVRPLSRLQVEDRLEELGDLYARTSGGDPREWDRARALFLRRLAADLRRPGFALLIAENPALMACAYGFSVCGDGLRRESFGGGLPEGLLRLAAAGRLFTVSEILVPPRVRTRYQNRDWNLARRLQRRLLTDHAATLGITLVRRSDAVTLDALRSWGWRCLEADGRGILPAAPCRVLLLRP